MGFRIRDQCPQQEPFPLAHPLLPKRKRKDTGRPGQTASVCSVEKWRNQDPVDTINLLGSFQQH